jgi:dolichyl-phosphate-mannose-protein mannosyltransferase
MAYLYYFYRSTVDLAVRDNLQFGSEMGSVSAAIAAGRGFSSPLFKNPSGPTAWFVPIYPYLLAAIFKIFGIYSYPSGLIIRTLDAALSAFTCWPIWAIGNKTFGKATGKAAAWTWVFLPTSLYFSVVWVWDTALATLWMAFLFDATLSMRGCDKPRWWLGYGALWGVAAMINPSLLSVLPFLALWAIWPLRYRLADAARLAALASVIFIACITPWTIRNYVVFHKFIPLRSNFGLELWVGNNSAVGIMDAVYLHPNDNPAEGLKYVRMTEIPYMADKQREAFHFMRTHPADTARFMWHRFADTWLGTSQSPSEAWNGAPLYAKAFMVWTWGFSLLSLLGVLFAYRSGNYAAYPFAWVMLVFPLMFIFTHTSQRYSFPMSPIMQILAAYAVVFPLTHLARYFTNSSVATAITVQSSS